MAWIFFFFFHIEENMNLSRKSVPQMGAAVSNAPCVSNILMDVRPAGENDSSFLHIPYPAGSKDINAADWLPNGPWKSVR